MGDSTSEALFERAQRHLVAGVNSPVRAFRAVGGHPVFIKSAAGSRIFGADGKAYIDYVGSWGPAILGHADPAVLRAVKDVADRGLSFGAPTEAEIELAEMVVDRYPSMELLRCVSSGTEATMSALRVARGFTGRDIIVKFDGCYHGHSDALLVKAGSGLATFGVPDSAGVTQGTSKTTLTLAYNDIPALETLFNLQGKEIAAVIVEPVAGNMGCVPPEPGFLEAIVALCTKHGALSIFDEVMTGSRLARGGAQERYGLKPDLTTLGKIVGGGLPLAVYGGRADVMRKVAPLGPVYQAGTLSGNPLAVAAGMATLRALVPAVYDKLETRSAALEAGLNSAITSAKTKAVVQRVGSMLTLFFREGRVSRFSDAAQSNTKKFAVFHQSLLRAGVYWPPSQFEAAFVSAAHGEEDIAATCDAARGALVEAEAASI